MIIIYIGTLFWAITCMLLTFYFTLPCDYSRTSPYMYIHLQNMDYSILIINPCGTMGCSRPSQSLCSGGSPDHSILWTVYLVAGKPELIWIISACVIHVHTSIMCGSRKYWYPQQGRSLEILRAKFFKRKYEAKLEFPQGRVGWGGVGGWWWWWKGYKPNSHPWWRYNCIDMF